jgi:hypothetical protein
MVADGSAIRVRYFFWRVSWHRTKVPDAFNAFQTCHQRSFGEKDDFPWGKAVPVVALYNGTTAWFESPWCLRLAVHGERK